jgi:hypothetical protein
MNKLERVARAICMAAGDDPDALAYPPMEPLCGRKAAVIYVPTGEWNQPKPCWNWYTSEARAAIEAMQ